MGRRWTEEEEQELRRLMADGVRVKDIAERLGRSVSATTDKLNVMRLDDGQMPRRHVPWTPEDDAALRRLWDEGRSMKDIATVLGRKVSTVKGRRQKLRLVPRVIRLTEEEREEVIRMRTDGKTKEEIRRHIGISETTVTRICKEAEGCR